MGTSGYTGDDTVVCTEHVRSNIGWALGVIVSGSVLMGLLLLPLFSSSFWLILVRWIGVVALAVLDVLALIQILNYFNRRLAAGPDGIDYTDCLGRTRHFGWDEVVAYDDREKGHSLKLVLRGHLRTFHESSTDFDGLIDIVSDHVGLIACSDK